MLAHRTWYAVRNDGWTGVAPFVVHYLVQVGDASNDRFVLFNDLTLINAKIGGAIGVPDDDRRDITGDGIILFNDLTIANGSIPSLNNVPKPTGHGCH